MTEKMLHLATVQGFQMLDKQCLPLHWGVSGFVGIPRLYKIVQTFANLKIIK
jgi:hypothetical protein